MLTGFVLYFLPSWLRGQRAQQGAAEGVPQTLPLRTNQPKAAREQPGTRLQGAELPGSAGWEVLCQHSPERH